MADSLWRRGTLLVFLVASGALIRDTYYNGHDCEVFWRTARNLIELKDCYSLAPARGMVPKYPPWILPLFLPLGLFDLPTAKLLWGVLQVFCLGAAGAWVRVRARVQWKILLAVGLSFWGLWAVHALDGQLPLLILASSLWFWPGERELKPSGRSIALTWMLSMKVFTALPLFFFRLDRSWLRTLAASAIVFALLCIPAYWADGSGSVVVLFQRWAAAASSSGALMGSEHVRGVTNPSFTGAILSGAGISAQAAWADAALAIGLGSLLGGLWARFSRGLSSEERWAGWLGLVPAIHPLPWWHMFVLAFPLAAVSVDRAFIAGRSRTPGTNLARGASVLGVFLLAAGTRKFLAGIGLGEVGGALELFAGKSFGILLCGAALILHRRS